MSSDCGSVTLVTESTLTANCVHGVVLSLPTLADVIGYELGEPAVARKVRSGYPRFVQHVYINALMKDIRERLASRGQRDALIWLLLSDASATHMLTYVRSKCGPAAGGSIISPHDLGYSLPEDASLWRVVIFPEGDAAPVCKYCKEFLQHTGARITSRQAQDVLRANGLFTFSGVEHIPPTVAAAPACDDDEALYEGDAAGEALRILQSVMPCADGRPAPALLTSCGMNSFYATYAAIQDMWACRGRATARDTWLQIGWLYLDTTEVIRKFHGVHGIVSSDPLPPLNARVDVEPGLLRICDVGDFDLLHDVLALTGDRIAGIITEMPTNPLVQCCDLNRLRRLCTQYEVPLVLDPTVAGLGNLNILPHADAVVLSLTKFAACNGDVMAGGILLNPDSPFFPDLQARLGARGAPTSSSGMTVQPSRGYVCAVDLPYSRDLRRLAEEMQQLQDTVTSLNRNTTTVARWLEERVEDKRATAAGVLGVHRVHWAYSSTYSKEYTALAGGAEKPGSMITIELEGTQWGSDVEEDTSDVVHARRVEIMRAFYDRFPLSKGPSFGTTFTVMCAFMWLAHYDLVSTQAGRAHLRSVGLNPYLLRISVGKEAPEVVLAAIQRGLGTTVPAS